MALTRTDSGPLFTADAANTLRLVGYLAVAIVLMVADHRGGYLSRTRYVLNVGGGTDVPARRSAGAVRT